MVEVCFAFSHQTERSTKKIDFWLRVLCAWTWVNRFISLCECGCGVVCCVRWLSLEKQLRIFMNRKWRKWAEREMMNKIWLHAHRVALCFSHQHWHSLTQTDGSFWPYSSANWTFFRKSFLYIKNFWRFLVWTFKGWFWKFLRSLFSVENCQL